MHSLLIAQNVLSRSVVVCSTFVSNEGILLSAAALFQNLLTLPCDNILGERHFFARLPRKKSSLSFSRKRMGSLKAHHL